jgi:hypothetical protein
MEKQEKNSGTAEMEAPGAAGAWSDDDDDSNECPLCRDWKPGPRLLAAMEEGDAMSRDPSLGKAYDSVKELFAEILASGDDED